MTGQYRRTVPAVAADYPQVHLGELNELNTGGDYTFPTLAAAARFAQNHEKIAAVRGVTRIAMIVHPDGLVTDSHGRHWDGQQWITIPLGL